MTQRLRYSQSPSSSTPSEQSANCHDRGRVPTILPHALGKCDMPPAKHMKKLRRSNSVIHDTAVISLPYIYLDNCASPRHLFFLRILKNPWLHLCVFRFSGLASSTRASVVPLLVESMLGTLSFMPHALEFMESSSTQGELNVI